MNKKLPGVFVNRIDKKFTNNNNIFYGSSTFDRKINTNDKTSIIIGNSINQKINNLFSSSNYIYKAQVKIILKDKTIDTTIIGRNKDFLITMNNESIAISDIIDIRQSKNRLWLIFICIPHTYL